jgi:hypothetical protein
MAKPLDKIAQQVDRFIVLRAASGLGRSVSDPRDQSFRCFHCAGGAKQVERGSSILDSCPDSQFGTRIRIGRGVKTTIVKVARGTDKADCRVQLLIAEPALMFLPALKPGPSYHASDTNECTD